MSRTLDPFLGGIFHKWFAANPMIIFDAGAAGEVFNPFESNFSRSRVFAFEPAPTSLGKLKRKYKSKKGVSIFGYALSESTGTAQFTHLPDTPTNSSLQTGRFRPGMKVEEFEVQTKRIVDLCPNEIPYPDFVKLDTEGHECSIIEGSGRIFKEHVVGVYAEFEFDSPKDRGCSFRDLDAALTERNFILFDIQIGRGGIRHHGGKKDRITGGNALYLKDVFKCVRTGCVPKDPQQLRSQCLKLISACSAYIYLDYAIEVAEFALKEGAISPAENFAIKTFLSSWIDPSLNIPNFPMKGFFADLFELLSYLLRPNMKKGIPPLYNNIGNRPRVMRRRKPVSTYEIAASVENRFNTESQIKAVVIREGHPCPKVGLPLEKDS